MFDVNETLGPVNVSGRGLWKWQVEFSPVRGLNWKLIHTVEGLSPDTRSACDDMQAAREAGIVRLKALGFEIRDDAA